MLVFFFLLSFSLSAPRSVSGAEVSPCDATWHYYNETGCCYKTTSDLGTWFQGTEMCAKLRLGSHLASLHSEEESKWVATKHRNGLDGIHAWTGLSQTQIANNWTYTDGSKPWSWFHAPFPFVHNHTSCVEIIDNWLVELLQNSGKTQPTFCFYYLKSLCKYCPVPAPITILRTSSTTTTTAAPPVTRIAQAIVDAKKVAPTTPPVHKMEKAHPRSDPLALLSDCSGRLGGTAATTKPTEATTTTAPRGITTTIRSVLAAKTTTKPRGIGVDSSSTIRPTPSQTTAPTTTSASKIRAIRENNAVTSVVPKGSSVATEHSRGKETQIIR